MTRTGHLAAIGAVVLGTATLATWPHPTSTPVAPAQVRPAGASGADLFQAKGCASCHTGPDTTAHFDGFPSLLDAPNWAGRRRPGYNAERYLTESIRSPDAFISPAFTGSAGPTTAMPQLALTDTEIATLTRYLLTP